MEIPVEWMCQTINSLSEVFSKIHRGKAMSVVQSTYSNSHKPSPIKLKDMDQGIKQMLALLNANPNGVIGQAPGIEEVHHVVAEFVCESHAGKLIVKLLDAGPEFHAQEYRYNVCVHVEGQPKQKGDRERWPHAEGST